MAGISYEKKFQKENFSYHNNIIEFIKKNNLEDCVNFKQKKFHFDNGLKAFPICNLCSNTNYRFKVQENKYHVYCSVKCSQRSPEALERREATVLKKTGCRNVFQTKEVIEKINKTFEKKYKCKRASQNPIFLKKQKQTLKDRTGYEYALQNPETKKKQQKTLLDKYGEDNYMKTPEGKKKVSLTCIEKYGVSSYLATEENREHLKEVFKDSSVKEKRKNTLKKYGEKVNSSFQIPEVHEKIVKKWLEKYGVVHPRKAQIIIQKIQNTNLKRHGVRFGYQKEGSKVNTSILEDKLKEIFNVDKVKIEGKRYDLFFKEKRTIVEVDGDYYHTLKLYNLSPMQISTTINDEIKQEILLDKDIKLIRVKHSDLEIHFLKNESISFKELEFFSYEKKYEVCSNHQEIFNRRLLKRYFEEYNYPEKWILNYCLPLVKLFYNLCFNTTDEFLNYFKLKS